MNGRTFKICGCRDETGKQLGSSCPRLRGRNHGSWAFMVDLAKDENGRRRQLKRSGFTTKAEAEAHLEDAVGNVRAGRKVDDKLTVGTWLDRWLDEKTGESGISAAGRPIRSATQVGYRQHVRDYLKPHLGHILLSKLSSEDISRAYRKIMAESAEKVAKAEAQHSALQPINGKSGEAPKPYPRTRVAGPTTLRRVHACLRASLNAAVRSRRLAYNPALGVDLPAAPKQQVRPWEPYELGSFLDHVQAHRLGALFEVLAACGLRRGEALGLAWSDIDFVQGTLTIRRQLLNAWVDGAPVFGEPKTATGRRIVEVDSRTLGTLIAHRLTQDAERAAWGRGYEDHDLVFAQEHGRPLDPSHVTKLFCRLAAEAGLRRVRLHDLRHGSASLMLAAGIPVEVVSKRLGHSSISVTTDIYSHLLEGVGRRAAEAAMGLVPRSPKATTETSSDHMVTTVGPKDADGAASAR